MKLKSLLLLGVFVVTSVAAFAGNASLFSYDKNAVHRSMKNVSAVENYVNSNEGVTLTTMNAEGTELATAANLSTSSSLSSSMFDGPAGIPSFLWGCVLGWIGILIVYLVTQDSDETKKALYGCLIGWGVGFLLYLLFWVVIFGNAALWSL